MERALAGRAIEAQVGAQGRYEENQCGERPEAGLVAFLIEFDEPDQRQRQRGVAQEDLAAADALMEWLDQGAEQGVSSAGHE